VAKDPQVKVLRIKHGFLGRAHTKKIEREISKWMGKGYRLDKQEDQPGGCLRGGYTLLTFIKNA
jgi:hypothetical protein